jgi:hypothetical protein
MLAHESSLSALGALAMDSRSADPSLDLQRFRPYLLVLAKAQNHLAGEEASDLVQKFGFKASREARMRRSHRSKRPAMPMKMVTEPDKRS